ncbi:hypothetical protein HDU82_002380 [Entophlyctis luteolus]|nr:hypothetical protein HDU82_002380 [Entophlyctis luteolus]
MFAVSAAAALAFGWLLTVAIIPPSWIVRVARLVAAASAGVNSRRRDSHRIFFARTHHSRFVPTQHSFSFNIVYAGIVISPNLNGCELPNKSNTLFFARNARALLSVWDDDYLIEQGNGSIYDKVMKIIEDSKCQPFTIGRVELISTPRFFGFKSFNPLSVYYVFEQGVDSIAKVIILEVNNTFGERHLYVLDERNKWIEAKRGPFNNRSGIYEAHVSRFDEDRMGILLILKDYVADGDELDGKKQALAKHLTASVSGTSVLMTPATIICLLTFSPFNAFLTMPRIMTEAWKLAYVKKLRIYPKPNPMRPSALLKGKGKTIRYLPTSEFDEICKKLVLDFLVEQCSVASIRLSVIFLNQVYIDVCGSGWSETQVPAKFDCQIYILSPNFFSRLVIDFNNPGRSLCATFLSGDWSGMTKLDVSVFVSLFKNVKQDPSPAIPTSKSVQSALSINEWYHGDSLETFPPFATRMKLSRVPVFTRHSDIALDDLAAKVYWATLHTWALEYAFRRVTRFVVDPCNVVARVLAEYSVSREVDKELLEHLKERDGMLMGEMDDSVDYTARERLRFAILRDCVECADGVEMAAEQSL